MTRESIYSLALRMFNMDYSKIEDGAIERELCEEFIGTSEEFCLSAAQWTFLMQSHAFTEEERVQGSFMNLGYGYEMPDGMFSVCFVNGEYNADFAVRGKEIFFYEENPTVDYITSVIDYENFPYPTTFAHLLATQLAVKIAPMLSPDIQLESRIAQQYAIYYQQLSNYNLASRRRMDPPPKDIIPPHGSNRFHADSNW